MSSTGNGGGSKFSKFNTILKTQTPSTESTNNKPVVTPGANNTSTGIGTSEAVVTLTEKEHKEVVAAKVESAVAALNKDKKAKKKKKVIDYKLVRTDGKYLNEIQFLAKEDYGLVLLDLTSYLINKLKKDKAFCKEYMEEVKKDKEGRENE